MTKSIFLPAFLFLGMFFCMNTTQAQTSSCDQLYEWVVFGEEHDGLLLGERLYQPELLISFYTQNNCKPVWSSEQIGMARADTLIGILENAEDVDNYHLATILDRYTELQTFYVPLGLANYNELDKLDVILSDAALHYFYRLRSEERVLTPKQKEELGMRVVEELQYALAKNKLEEMFNLSPDEELTIAETVNPTKFNSSSVAGSMAILDTLKNAQPTISNTSIYDLIGKFGQDPVVLQRKLHFPKTTLDFYRQRDYKAAWTKNRSLQRAANQLMVILGEGELEGLNTKDYHYSTLQGEIKNLNTRQLPELDVLLTDAALRYANHLAYGKLDPKQFGHSWNIDKDEINLTALLNEALSNNKLESFYEGLKPQHKAYGKLKNALASYSKEATGATYTPIPGGGKLEVGMEEERVKTLRSRLGMPEGDKAAFNDKKETFSKLANFAERKKFNTEIAQAKNKLSGGVTSVRLNNALRLELSNNNYPPDTLVVRVDSFFNASKFDKALKEEVIAFQKSNSLTDDGVVGRNTFAALNVSVEYRIQQIKINLERWRWLPNDIQGNYLLVNIPAYMLYIYERDDELVLKKKVQVGKTKHKTPVFNDMMQYMDFNPYWTVPFSIATKEILPKLRHNPGYIPNNNMEVLAGGKAISPFAINWSGIDRTNFHFTIRQKPGAKNALGRVKFMFPNLYNVYLHDTPSKSLFSKDIRAYSHGCVRLEKPFELAEYLLKDDPKWSNEKIQKMIERGKNKRVHLTNPRPIYILYFTAWVDEQGELQFYKDIYDRDQKEIDTL